MKVLDCRTARIGGRADIYIHIGDLMAWVAEGLAHETDPMAQEVMTELHNKLGEWRARDA